MEEESESSAAIKKPRGRARKRDAPVKHPADNGAAAAPDVPRRSMQKRLVNVAVDTSKSLLEQMSCILCNRQLENREALEHHYMADHTRLWKPDFPEGVDNNASLSVILKKLGCLKCQSCLKEFNGVQYYKFHREWCGREREEAVCDLCHRTQKAMWMGHHKRSCAGGAGAKSTKGRSEDIIRPGQRRSAAMKALETLEAFKDGDDMLTDGNQKDGTFQVSADEAASASDDDENTVDDNDEAPRSKSARRDGKTFKKELNPLPECLGGANKQCFKIQLEHQLVAETSTCCPSWLPFAGTWTYSPLPATIKDGFAGCISSVKPLHLQYCHDQEKCGHTVEPLQSAICSDDIFCCNITAPVSTMAWCPVPLTPEPQLQYLAVALQHVTEYEDHYNHTSAIQLWDYGFLERPNDACPSCVMLIQHDYGQLWDMRWCPYGAWQPGSREVKSETRLGVLAVAASDGNAYILSIPRPPNQPSARGCRVATQRAAVKLSGGTSPCLCVEWQYKGGTTVVAGFADGTVCLWSLDDKDYEAKSQSHIVLLPYECIQVQPSCVRTIRWCPSSPYLFATISLLDRCVTVWDTRDLSSPHTVVDHHGMVPTDMDWGSYYDGIFVTSDDVCKVNGENPLYFFESGYLGLAPRAVQNTYGTSWSVSFCNWTSCIVTSNDRGSVFLTPVPNLYRSRKASEFRIYELMKLKYCNEPAKLDSAASCHVELVMANIASLSKQYKPQKEANETILSYPCPPKPTFKLVRFNPNPGCHAWLASASNCGLLVVTCLRSTANVKQAAELEACRSQRFAKR